jgi:exodeoxyribonuclease VII small subunit
LNRPVRGAGFLHILTRPVLPFVPETRPDAPLDFETALSQLEALVSSMEAGQLSLEESLAAYKRGAELLNYCQSQLQAAQQQVKILEGNGAQDPGRDDEQL